jgi:hypothetical protein
MDTPTQAPYEIAKYLSDEAKCAALARSYAPASPDDRLCRPRCADGMCPLGVALRAMGKHNAYSYCPVAPDETEVAELLEDDGAREPARLFIDDWDEGRITDLAAALGVS